MRNPTPTRRNNNATICSSSVVNAVSRCAGRSRRPGALSTRTRHVRRASPADGGPQDRRAPLLLPRGASRLPRAPRVRRAAGVPAAHLHGACLSPLCLCLLGVETALLLSPPPVPGG